MTTHADFSDLQKMLELTCDEITAETKRITKSNAKKLAKNIQRASPVRKSGTSKTAKGKILPPGTYAKGWTDKQYEETSTGVTYKVYNRSRQQPLVHLLQFGHNLPQGGRSKAIDHVFKERDKIEEAYVKEIEEAINHANIKGD